MKQLRSSLDAVAPLGERLGGRWAESMEAQTLVVREPEGDPWIAPWRRGARETLRRLR